MSKKITEDGTLDGWDAEAEKRERKEKERLNTEVKVLFGEMIFTNSKYPQSCTATIYRVDHHAWCKVKDLDDFCEAGLDKYECYLVPSEYTGAITYIDDIGLKNNA